MEILGVITLLALISLIIILSTNKSLKDSKESLYQAQLEEIKAAAEMWKTDNIELIPNSGYYIMSLEDLQETGYIKKNIINPKTDKPFDKIIINVGLKDTRVEDSETVIKEQGYTRLDYIKSTGNQYINLNYKAKTNTEIRLDMRLIENSNTNSEDPYSDIIGMGSYTGDRFNINFGERVDQNKTLFYWVDKSYAAGGIVYKKQYNSITSRSTLIVKSGLATFQRQTNSIATKTSNNTDDMILLGTYVTATNRMQAFSRYDVEVYGMQIYEGNIMVKNLIPCKKNNQVGLYDTLGTVFYTSDGTGVFEYGEI